MLVACRLAGLSALEAYYAGIRRPPAIRRRGSNPICWAMTLGPFLASDLGRKPAGGPDGLKVHSPRLRAEGGSQAA